ncbi:MAG: extracellular solute-binding protein, partial [Bdellovibrionales bacterium]|nr:extracellular solute-binding protein [Bdellovibrionales bacterium]
MNSIFKVFLVLSALASFHAHSDLVVYSDREPDRFEGAIADYQKANNDSVVVVMFDNYGKIVERLQAEGVHSPADLVITKDLVYLKDLKNKDLLQSFDSSPVIDGVPAYMRALNNEWVALAIRARTFVFNPSFLSKSDLTTYADLADPKWEGGLCVRTSNSSYNQALVAGLIEQHSYEGAKGIVAGWLKNLAAAPFSGDTAVIQAVAEGQCAIGLVNHYYYAGIKAKEPNFPVELAFANQGAEGVFMNGTGLALLKTSKQKESAQKLLEAMLSEKNQL